MTSIFTKSLRDHDVAQFTNQIELGVPMMTKPLTGRSNALATRILEFPATRNRVARGVNGYLDILFLLLRCLRGDSAVEIHAFVDAHARAEYVARNCRALD